MRTCSGETIDLDIDLDVEEEGGVETEEVVLDWLRSRSSEGFTAKELSACAEITQKQAEERLANLWENEFVSVEGGVSSSRFFLGEHPTPKRLYPTPVGEAVNVLAAKRPRSP